jgi:DNA-directed RNA polymerase beta subunit
MRTIEEFVTAVYSLKAKAKKREIESKVTSVVLKHEDKTRQTYEVTGDIYEDGQYLKSSRFTFDVPKMEGVTEIKKMTINIALVRPVIKTYGGKQTVGASFSGLYINTKSNEVKVGNEHTFPYDVINQYIMDGQSLPDEYKEVRDYELSKPVVEKMKLILDTDDIDPKVSNKKTWQQLVDIATGNTDFKGELPVTPQDLELFDYRKGLIQHLESDANKIKEKSYPMLAIHKGIYAFPIQGSIKRFFLGNMTTLKMVQTTLDSNPLSMQSQKNKIVFLDSRTMEKMPVNSPFLDGLLDPVRTAEGAEVNLKNELSLASKFTDKEISILVYDKNFNELRVSIDEYQNSPVLSFENIDYKRKTTKLNANGVYKYSLRSRYHTTKSLDGIKYYRHPASLLSVSTSIMPMINRNDSIRDLLAAHFNSQAIPTSASQPSIIYTSFSKKLYEDTQTSVRAPEDGEVIAINDSKDTVKIKTKDGRIQYVSCNEPGRVSKYNQTTNHTYNVYEPVVEVGQKVRTGTPVFALNSFKNGELALAVPLITAYSTLRGYETDDGFVLSESAVAKLNHKEVMKIDIKLEPEKYRILDESVLPTIGKEVEKDDIIFSYIKVHEVHNVIAKIFDMNRKVDEEVTYKLPEYAVNGKVVDVRVSINPKADSESIYYQKMKDYQDKCLAEKRKFYDNPVYVEEFPRGRDNAIYDFIIHIEVEYYDRMKLTDKLTNRASSKGVLVAILPDDQMPRTLKGTVIECVMPALSMASRKNYFSVMECKLTKLSHRLKELLEQNKLTNDQWNILKTLYAELPDDKITREYILGHFVLGDYLRIQVDPFDTTLTPELVDEMLAKVGIPNGGKEILIDGVTGRKIRTPILVGMNEFFRLHFVSQAKGASNPIITYTDKVVMGVGKHRYEGQKYGKQEVEAMLASGAEDFAVDVTEDVGDRKNAQFRSALTNLLMRIKN